MRLAVITPGYAPAIGGVESVVTNVSRSLARLGVDVEVWTQSSARPRAAVEQRDGDVVVRRFPASGSSRYSVSTALWRHARRHAGEFDVVHAHSYHSTAWLGLVRAAGRPAYVVSPHYHGGGHTTPARAMHVAYRPLASRLMREASAVVAVSAAEAELIERDFRHVWERITVIHHGIDAETIAAAVPWSGEAPTALVVGRLEPYKRVDSVIRAFADSSAPGQLVIVGDGLDRTRLAELAGRSPRSEDIHLLGALAHADLARWLRTAQVVVNMSEHEAFGLVTLEAAAAGAAVVLSDLPAHREVARVVETGVRVLADRAGGLRRALDEALTEPRPGSRRVRSWDAVAREHLDIYAQVAPGTAVPA